MNGTRRSKVANGRDFTIIYTRIIYYTVYTYINVRAYDSWENGYTEQVLFVTCTEG